MLLRIMALPMIMVSALITSVIVVTPILTLSRRAPLFISLVTLITANGFVPELLIPLQILATKLVPMLLILVTLRRLLLAQPLLLIQLMIPPSRLQSFLTR